MQNNLGEIIFQIELQLDKGAYDIAKNYISHILHHPSVSEYLTELFVEKIHLGKNHEKQMIQGSFDISLDIEDDNLISRSQYFTDFLEKSSISSSFKPTIEWLAYRAQLFYCRLLNYEGFFQAASKFSQELLLKTKNLNDPFLHLDIIIEILESLYKLGKFDHTTQYFVLSEKILENKTDYSGPAVIQRINSFRLIHVGILWQTGHWEEAQAELSIQLNIQKQKENHRETAKILSLMGVIQNTLGNFEESRKLTYEALLIEKQMGNMVRISVLYKNLGWLHLQRGELSKSLQYLNASKAILAQINVEYRLSGVLCAIGNVLREKGDLEKAISYLENGIEISERYGNNYELSSEYLELIRTYVLNGEYRKANEIYLKLEFLDPDNFHPAVILRKKIGNAIILKSSSRARDKFRAQGIFQFLLSEKIPEHELRVFIVLNLCELLLDELNVSQEDDIISELTVHLNQLFAIADRQRSYLLLAHCNYFLAKLAILELDLSRARGHLSEAAKLVENYDLKSLSMKIDSELEYLSDQRNFFRSGLVANDAGNDLTNSSISSNNNSENNNLFSTDSSLWDVTPVILLINSENGPNLYNFEFETASKVNSQLFGGFISAIETFSNEAFEESFDRAKMGNHNIVIKRFSPMIIAFIFKGSIQKAQNQLQDFINHRKVSSIFQSLSERQKSYDEDNIPFVCQFDLEEKKILAEIIHVFFQKS